MVGGYFELEKAKQSLKDIDSGSRLIAEVDGYGKLIRDPHIVGGQNQGLGTATGFNKDWEGFQVIDKLMDMSQAYLESSGISKQRNAF